MYGKPQSVLSSVHIMAFQRGSSHHLIYLPLSLSLPTTPPELGPPDLK